MSAHLKKEVLAAIGLFIVFSAIGHSFIDGAICMFGAFALFAFIMAKERIKFLSRKPGIMAR
ncbi:MAG TPA: hypothetical protein VK638_06080 [Edaphobacter sp.]|nr:hypothetical protein [Edaphobacter sp.]